jgi:NAD(P)-dependent dehydrogenase (short-subunit alcohol dehydrogenase family)
MSTEHGVALITGAGRGLGRAFAIALAENEYKVALTARTEAEINATAEVITSNGGRAIAIPGDVTDRQAVEQAVATTEAELGPITVLINNAGVLNGGLIGTIDPDEWWRDIEINLRGPFLFVNAILPGMLTRGQGRIINIASGAGLQAIETGASYCVSKAALIRLSEMIALETTKQGLATFAIHPGTLRTPMNLRFMESEDFMESEEMRRRSPDVAAWFDQLFAEGQDTPIERSVQLILTLASGKADALSGCFLSVDDDLDALLAQADAIQNEGRLRLRLAE